MATCSLCHSTHTATLSHLAWPDRPYIHCQDCDLIYLPQEFHPSCEQEKQRYQLHQNASGEQGYIQFLAKILRPTLDYLRQNKIKIERALDYGSGPAAQLADLVQKKGIPCDLYDPYFSPEPPAQKYALIFCTEVVEHFRDPAPEWQKLISQLSPLGLLAVMTQLHPGPQLFGNWWYARDLTHLSFYSEKTLQYIASSVASALGPPEKGKLKIVYLQSPAILFALQ